MSYHAFSPLGVPNDGDVPFYQASDNTVRWGAGGGGTFLPLTETFYVDAGYAGGNSDGSDEAPFVTIQEAVDALTGAGTILVVNGTYGETVNCTVPVCIEAIGADGRFSNPGVIISEIISTELVILVNCLVSEGVTAVGVKGFGSVFNGDPGISSTGDVHLFNSQTDNIIAAANTVTTQNSSIANVQCLDLVMQGINGGNDITGLSDSGLSNGGSFRSFNAIGTNIRGELLQAGATGGGAPHANPPWKFTGCNFYGPGLEITLQGGGESLAVYLDKQSWGSFWSQTPVFSAGSPNFYQDSAIMAYQAYALAGDNTVATTADDDYHVITDVSGFSGSGSPWSAPTAGCVIAFPAAYVGLGTPPSTSPTFALVRVIATVITVAGGNVGLAIAYEGDAIGQDITNRTHGNQVVPAAAGVSTLIVAERIVSMAYGAADNVQPVFASDSGDDLTINTLTITIIPQETAPGY